MVLTCVSSCVFLNIFLKTVQCTNLFDVNMYNGDLSQNTRPLNDTIHVQYFHRMHKHIVLIQKRKGDRVDESGYDNTVIINPPLTTSRMWLQRISSQPIRQWQTKS